jgi:hypothetical protein
MNGLVATPKTLPELLACACAAYGREPNDELLNAWRAALDQTPIRELREALTEHQRDITPDGRDRRPRGSWFPSPADLLAKVEAKRQCRSTQRAKRGYCGRDECLGGWVWAEVSLGREPAVSRCPHCKALWDAGG